MTPHTCKVLTPGCYRCDLNRDEIQWSEDHDALEKVIEKAHEMCRFPDEDLAIDAAAAVLSWALTPEGSAVFKRVLALAPKTQV